MDVPVSVAIQKFKQDIVNDINNSDLHISVIEMIFEDIYDEIKNLAQSTAQQENEIYQRSLISEEQNIASDIMEDNN